MQEHTHNGIVAAAWTVAVVLVGLNLIRYAAIQLDGNPQTVWISKVLGSTLNFANVGAK